MDHMFFTIKINTKLLSVFWVLGKDINVVDVFTWDHLFAYQIVLNRNQDNSGVPCDREACQEILASGDFSGCRIRGGLSKHHPAVHQQAELQCSGETSPSVVLEFEGFNENTFSP